MKTKDASVVTRTKGITEDKQVRQAPLLPLVRLGRLQVTRMIIGGNPFRGISHLTRDLDQEMKDYYTCDNTVNALFECERQGVNTFISRADPIIFAMVRAYRERRGKMQWIAQTVYEAPDPKVTVREAAALGASAIYHHGSVTDSLWKDGRIDVVRETLKAIRDTGCVAGMSTHMPEVIRHVEDQGWDLDFYMACVYNLSKVEHHSPLAGKQQEEPFDDPDREIMCRVIRETKKPCLAFKILGAGRKCATPAMVQESFRFAFERIKPIDAVVVGMFQKNLNQVLENCRIVRDLCRE
jgi:hypothetical protein